MEAEKEGERENTKGGFSKERVVHSHCACTLEIRFWRISTSAATKWRESEKERDGARERVGRGGKRDRGERRRQLGQTLNNLDNGRTALNSCRFVQAHRLIRLAGRLQCRRVGGMG